MKKVILIIGAFILLIILMTGGWFLYYTKTPIYSLGIIKTAIEQHDLETFKEHVDIDTLLNNAIDDLIANDDDIGKNALANGVIKTFKPNMIEEFKKEIYASNKISINSNKNDIFLLLFPLTKHQIITLKINFFFLKLLN